MRIMTPATPRTGLALSSHPPLEDNGCLVEFLALDFSQFVPMDPFLGTRLLGNWNLLFLLPILLSTSRLVHVARVAEVTPLAV